MLTMAERGGGGVWTNPFLADIICEQPLRDNATSNKIKYVTLIKGRLLNEMKKKDFQTIEGGGLKRHLS